jgi:hypothetical protein
MTIVPGPSLREVRRLHGRRVVDRPDELDALDVRLEGRRRGRDRRLGSRVLDGRRTPDHDHPDTVLRGRRRSPLGRGRHHQATLERDGDEVLLNLLAILVPRIDRGDRERGELLRARARERDRRERHRRWAERVRARERHAGPGTKHEERVEAVAANGRPAVLLVRDDLDRVVERQLEEPRRRSRRRLRGTLRDALAGRLRGRPGGGRRRVRARLCLRIRGSGRGRRRRGLRRLAPLGLHLDRRARDAHRRERAVDDQSLEALAVVAERER